MSARLAKHHLDAFVAHTIATLPDSFRLRKTILVTLLRLLPRNYEERTRIKALLESLRIHESKQLTFEITIPPISNDGH